MTSPAAPQGHPLLARVHDVLLQQEQALRDGHADALPALDAQLQQALLMLRRACAGGGLQLAPQVLQALSQHAGRNQALLQRRQLAVAEALGALGAGQPLHEGVRSRSTYTPGGQVAAGRACQRSLARA